MTQKRVKASDVIGNSYYIYTLQSSNNTPSLNSTINITCNVTDVYGQAVSGKSITLYQNNTSKGAKTTDSNGNASWNSISMSSAGLQTFKVENSKIEIFVDNKSDVGHTHSQYLTEHQSLDNYVTTDDSRLSDSRTPTSHTHGNINNNGTMTVASSTMASNAQYIVYSDSANGALKRTDLVPASYIRDSVAHSSLGTGAGATQNTINNAISSKINDKLDKVQSSYKGKNVVTNASTGTIEFEDKPTIPSASSTTPSADTTNGSVGTGTTWARADHKHPKSTLYAEASHDHTTSDITNFPTLHTVATSGSYNDLSNKPNIPSKTSDLTNDSGYLTSHQDISNKENIVELITGTQDTTVTNRLLGTTTKLNSLQDGDKLLLKTPATANSYGTGVYLRITLTNGSTNDSLICDENGDNITRSNIPENTILLLMYKASSPTKWLIVNKNFNGDYNNLTNKPTIPSKTSDLTNDSGYLTSHQDISGKADSNHQHGNILNNGTVTASDNGVYTYVGGLDSRGDFYKTNKVNATSIIDRTAHANIGSSADTNQNTINTKIDTALGQLGNLAYEDNVDGYVGLAALSNDYNDLDNLPQLGAVALSNDYDDLDNLPTIPAPTTVNNLDSGFTTSTMQTMNVLHPTGSSNLMQYHFNMSVNADIGDLWDSIQNKEYQSNKVTSLSSASTDTQYPSAKLVYDQLNNKAPTSHASSSTTYGVATNSNYGHTKVINNLTTSSNNNGEALSANQGKVLNDNKVDKNDFNVDYVHSFAYNSSTENYGYQNQSGAVGIGVSAIDIDDNSPLLNENGVAIIDLVFQNTNINYGSIQLVLAEANGRRYSDSNDLSNTQTIATITDTNKHHITIVVSPDTHIEEQGYDYYDLKVSKISYDGSNITISSGKTRMEEVGVYIVFNGAIGGDIEYMNVIKRTPIVNQIIDMIYPIGSTYISVKSINPSFLFGGEWEQIQDRFLLASGSTYSAGSTGGEATHTLTTNEMPSHTHIQNSHNHTQNAHSHAAINGNGFVTKENTTGANNRRVTAVSSGSTYVDTASAANFHNYFDTNSVTATNQSATATNQNTGGGQAHNNMPPYLTVYMWKRIA